MTKLEVIAVAEATADAYAYDSYAPGAWQACCALLARQGFNAREIEAIVRSKWMRWAGDLDSDRRRYGRYNSRTLQRFLDNEIKQRGQAGLYRQVAELVAETF